MKNTTAIIVASPAEKGYPEFKTPEGYKAPEGSEDGEVFEELATFKVKSDGTMCLVEIAGVEVSSKKSEEVEETEDDEMGVAERFSSYQSGMGDQKMMA